MSTCLIVNEALTLYGFLLRYSPSRLILPLLLCAPLHSFHPEVLTTHPIIVPKCIKSEHTSRQATKLCNLEASPKKIKILGHHS